MPAKSKSQRRLFAMALSYKRGEYEGEPSEEVKELSELPEKTLRDYAKTSEEDLPENMHLNPNMNLPGIGDATLPGNPGSINQFNNQEVGSGDLIEPTKKKKKVKLLSFNKFLQIISPE
jgi:hypothetical protein